MTGIINGWAREFDDPILLPNRHTLLTLRDAATYITNLPKAKHAARQWQAAMEVLILVAKRNWPTILARIGFMRAFERVFNWERNERD